MLRSEFSWVSLGGGIWVFPVFLLGGEVAYLPDLTLLHNKKPGG